MNTSGRDSPLAQQARWTRAAEGVSAEEMSDRLEMGIRPRWVDYELGDDVPTVEVLRKLADQFAQSVPLLLRQYGYDSEADEAAKASVSPATQAEIQAASLARGERLKARGNAGPP